MHVNDTCQLQRNDGQILQIPKVWRYLFVMWHREPGQPKPRIRYYELHLN